MVFLAAAIGVGYALYSGGYVGAARGAASDAAEQVIDSASSPDSTSSLIQDVRKHRESHASAAVSHPSKHSWPAKPAAPQMLSPPPLPTPLPPPDNPVPPDSPMPPDSPTPPDSPMPPDSPLPPPKPDEPDKPPKPDKPEPPPKPDKPDKPSSPPAPDEPDKPDKPDKPSSPANHHLEHHEKENEEEEKDDEADELEKLLADEGEDTEAIVEKEKEEHERKYQEMLDALKSGKTSEDEAAALAEAQVVEKDAEGMYRQVVGVEKAKHEDKYRGMLRAQQERKDSAASDEAFEPIFNGAPSDSDDDWNGLGKANTAGLSEAKAKAKAGGAVGKPSAAAALGQSSSLQLDWPRRAGPATTPASASTLSSMRVAKELWEATQERRRQRDVEYKRMAVAFGSGVEARRVREEMMRELEPYQNPHSGGGIL